MCLLVEEKTKICNRCKKELPYHEDYFWKDKSKKDGFSTICINCKSNNIQKPSRDNKELETRMCTVCNVEKPLHKKFYHNIVKSKTIFCVRCKECKRIKIDKLGNEIKERPRRYVNEGYKFCKGCSKILPLTSEYFHTCSQSNSGFYSMCKNCKRERRYKFTKYSLESVLNRRYSSIKCRAKSKEWKIDFEKEYLLELWNKQNGLCALSGLQMTFSKTGVCDPMNVSVDRIDSNKHYTKDNVQLVCYVLNVMKTNLPMKEFLKICKSVIKYNKNK